MWSIAVDFQLYLFWTLFSAMSFKISEYLNPSDSFKIFNVKTAYFLLICSILYRIYYLGWLIDQEILLLPFREYFTNDWRIHFPEKIATLQYLEYNSLILRSPPFIMGCALAFHPLPNKTLLLNSSILYVNTLVFIISLYWCSLG